MACASWVDHPVAKRLDIGELGAVLLEGLFDTLKLEAASAPFFWQLQAPPWLPPFAERFLESFS
jgi:hypothetical protein